MALGELLHTIDGLPTAVYGVLPLPDGRIMGWALACMVRDADGIVDIIALGPLTNIAMAIKLDPGWAARLGRLVVMGGAADGRGNTTEIAEFNVAADPEAASVVFRAFSGIFRIQI